MYINLLPVRKFRTDYQCSSLGKVASPRSLPMASFACVIATAASLLALSAAAPADSVEFAETGERPHQLQKRGLVVPNPFPAGDPWNTDPLIDYLPSGYLHPPQPDVLDAVAPVDLPFVGPKLSGGPGGRPGRREHDGGKERRKQERPRNERGREEKRKPVLPLNGGCSCSDVFCPPCPWSDGAPIQNIPPPVAEPAWD